MFSFYYIRQLTAKTVELHIEPGLDKQLEEKIIRSLRSGGQRITSRDPHFLDPYLFAYYPDIIISDGFLKEKKIPPGTLAVFSFYCAVDLTSDLVRIDSAKKEQLFVEFSRGQSRDVFFKPIEELDLYKRILIAREDARPLVFYKTLHYLVENCPEEKTALISGLLDFPLTLPPEPLMVGFGGDFVIEEFVKYSLKKNGYDATLEAVEQILETPDIMSVNLEFVISHRGKRDKKKHFAFRASEKEFRVLSDSPVDLVSCANNHAADYGKISLLDTIDYLDKYGIKHSGTGKNLAEAFAPVTIDRDENRLAFYSICRTPLESRGFSMKDLKAGENSPGAAYYDLEYLKAFIQHDPSRLPIVQFHTGTEYAFVPADYTVKQARSLIDAGAAAVICHHPHVVNGIEIYKGKIIAYSLGDFLLDIQKPYADEGIILFLFILDNRIKSWAFYPTVCHYGSVLLTEERISLVEKRFLKLTAENF